MVRRLTIALQVIPGDAVELGDGLGGTGVQGAGKGRLFGTPRASKGPLHRRGDANGDITLGESLGATEDP